MRVTSRDLFLVKASRVGETATERKFTKHPAPQTQQSQQPLDWKNLLQKYAPYAGGAAGGGLAGYGVGRALGLGQGGSALLGAAGAAAVPYLWHRYKGGHFKPLFQDFSLENVGRALWGGK